MGTASVAEKMKLPSDLHEACAEFDSVARRAAQRPVHEQPELVDLQGRLWRLNRAISVQVERLAGAGADEALAAFRASVFNRSVVAHYRLHPEYDRLWTKPAGYSGDFRTIELLCRGESRWTRLDDVFLNHLVESNMSRQHRLKVMQQASFVRRALSAERDRPARLLNVGCGPCFDVRLALEGLGREVRGAVTCVDLDPEALRFSEARLRAVAPPSVELSFVRGDVVQFVRRAAAERPAPEYDAILFGGLFDYVPDRALSMILRRSAPLLADGGSILFSQVSTANPDRTMMDWVCDWRLIERDEDDLRRLIDLAGLTGLTTRMWRETSGVAILCELSR